MSKRFSYRAEDLHTGKSVHAATMKEAKELAKERSLTSGNVVAVLAVDALNGELHPQGAYYGRAWRGGAHHYPK